MKLNRAKTTLSQRFKTSGQTSGISESYESELESEVVVPGRMPAAPGRGDDDDDYSVEEGSMSYGSSSYASQTITKSVGNVLAGTGTFSGTLSPYERTPTSHLLSGS